MHTALIEEAYNVLLSEFYYIKHQHLRRRQQLQKLHAYS